MFNVEPFIEESQQSLEILINLKQLQPMSVTLNAVVNGHLEDC